MFQLIRRYAINQPVRFHGLIALISFIIYTSVILFGFIVTNNELLKSGYTTSDLQEATSRKEVDKILIAWENYTDVAFRLTVWDYVFIVAGFMLFVSLNSILIHKFENQGKLEYLPILGIILTILSRLSDALENLWGLLIYTNSDSYSGYLIPLLYNTSSIKWFIVIIEYSTIIIAYIVYFILTIKNRISNG